MKISTRSWSCDVCGKPIEKVEDGTVEWVIVETDGRRVGRNFRLVHYKTLSSCMSNEAIEKGRDGGSYMDLPLAHFAGPDGPMDLLCLIDEGEVPAGQIIEIIKRLFIEGYEQSRLLIDQAIADGVYKPARSKMFPSPEALKDILKWSKQ